MLAAQRGQRGVADTEIVDRDRDAGLGQRAEVGEQREAVFAVTIPEERGSFRRFCAALGQRSTTEFNYRIGNARCPAALRMAWRPVRSNRRIPSAAVNTTGASCGEP